MTIVEQLTAEETKVLALEATAKANADVIVKAQADLAASVKATDEMKVKISEMEKFNADSLKMLENEKAAHAETQQKLATAQVALDNPAFAAAAAKGSKQAVAEGGAEQIATITPAQAKAEYHNITDPKARAEYRAKYRKELGLE